MSSNIDVAAIFDAQKQVRIFRCIMFIITLILAIYSYIAFATPRVSDKIYSQLQSNHYCGRRLSATNQTGCTSNLGGNTGIVWAVKGQEDIKHLLETGSTPPYIAILDHTHFTRANIESFIKNSDRIAGVIFRHDPSDSPNLFSPDDVCPNRYSGLYVNDTRFENCRANVWQNQSQVSGLLQLDIPFPIFLMNDPNSLTKIDECFNKNKIMKGLEQSQASYPLCGIQLDSFMLAAVDSTNCLNTHTIADQLLQSNGQRCYNVENENVFAYYKTAESMPVKRPQTNVYVPSTVEDNSVVMVIAKSSSISMFSDISPGADSTITSIVTMQAIAHALGQPSLRNSSKVTSSNRNIVFALLDSEPFDYIGSTAMVEYMIRNRIPHASLMMDKPVMTISNLNISSIDYIINLDQMAPQSQANKIYLHSEPDDLVVNQKKLDTLNGALQAHTTRLKLDLQYHPNPRMPLPPTSVQQFIKQSRLSNKNRDDQQRLLGVVVSNYDQTYTNPYYHSVYDNALRVGLSLDRPRLVDHLTKTAGALAGTIYELAFGTRVDVEASKDLISDLLDCYLLDGNCTQFTQVMISGQTPRSGPVLTYRDKLSDYFTGHISSHLLSYHLGDSLPDLNRTQCSAKNEQSFVYNYYFINGPNKKEITNPNEGICIRHQTALIRFDSPAYSVDAENVVHIDKRFPAWTASFDGIRNPVRLFMIPSPIYGWVLLISGSLTTLASVLIINGFNQALAKRRILTNEPTST